MIKNLSKVLLLLLVALAVSACKKDDSKPADGGSGGGGGGNNPQQMANSFTAMVTESPFNPGEYTYLMFRILVNLPADVGNITLNNAVYEREELFPGIPSSATYTTDSDSVNSPTWLLGKTVTWNIAGKGTVPAFTMTNSRWSTYDFVCTPGSGVHAVSNGLTITFNKNVTADWLSVNLTDEDGTQASYKITSSFSGTSITVPASEMNKLKRGEISYNINLYTANETNIFTVNGVNIAAINQFITKSYYIDITN
jgi:hypothetical protein